MKKIISILAIVIFTTYGCSKEGNPIFLIREHWYEITSIPAKTSTGDIVDLRRTLFGFIDHMTLKLSGIGSGNGVIKITSTAYTDTQLAFYGWTYDYVYQCWYYDYGTYQITLTSITTNEYGFKWHRRGIPQITLDLADFADVSQGTHFQDFWKILEQPYDVYPDEMFPAPNSLVAKRIALKGASITIVLEH